MTLCQNETTAEPLKTYEHKHDSGKNGFTTAISWQKETANESIRQREENFLKRAEKLHRGKYDYSEFGYINIRSEGVIICPKHGKFLQTPDAHLKSGGCVKCHYERLSVLKSSNLEEFVSKAQKQHGNKFDYSEFVYKNNSTKGIIKCPIHGKFLQIPQWHIDSEYGCPLCGKVSGINKITKTKKEFIADAIHVHGQRYDYTNFSYEEGHLKGIIICKKHGQFEQSPNSHLKGSGCPKCNFSKGELKIMVWLESNNIDYIHQKTFENCKNPRTNFKLKFDFFLPSKNLLIEFDGLQHFCCGYIGKHKYSVADVKFTMYKDNLKTKYARKSSIKLLRIKYTDISKINDILERIICS